MKKIVALVLSLVMVLGLATTAFGATNVKYNNESVDLTDWTVVDLTTGDYEEFEDDTMTTKMVWGNVTETVNDETTTYYGVTVYGPVNVLGLQDYYCVVVAKDYANVQLETADGKTIYARALTESQFRAAEPYTELVVDAFIDKADVTTKCGACKLDVAVVGEDYYEAEGTTLAYYKGEFVLIGAKKAVTDVFTAHAFMDDNNATADCKWNIVDNKFTSVKCACGDSFKVVQSVAGLKSGTYVGTAMNVAGESNWVVLAATTTPDAPSTDKVESAETFDAGIAMYVGMSVMAAAGSAVVLKKKD